jgi:hypothetical protein
MEIPYDGAKEMILADDIDNREFLCKLVRSMWEELPEKNNQRLLKNTVFFLLQSFHFVGKVVELVRYY